MSQNFRFCGQRGRAQSPCQARMRSKSASDSSQIKAAIAGAIPNGNVSSCGIERAMLQPSMSASRNGSAKRRSVAGPHAVADRWAGSDTLFHHAVSRNLRSSRNSGHVPARRHASSSIRIQSSRDANTPVEYWAALLSCAASASRTRHLAFSRCTVSSTRLPAHRFGVSV